MVDRDCKPQTKKKKKKIKKINSLPADPIFYMAVSGNPNFVLLGLILFLFPWGLPTFRIREINLIVSAPL